MATDCGVSAMLPRTWVRARSGPGWEMAIRVESESRREGGGSERGEGDERMVGGHVRVEGEFVGRDSVRVESQSSEGRR